MCNFFSRAKQSACLPSVALFLYSLSDRDRLAVKICKFCTKSQVYVTQLIYACDSNLGLWEFDVCDAECCAGAGAAKPEALCG